MAAPNLSFRACVHRESPLGSVLVEPQDIERAVAARDLAIAVIGAEPLIEDFRPRVRPVGIAEAWTDRGLRCCRPQHACLVITNFLSGRANAGIERFSSQACNSQSVSYYSMTRPSCAAFATASVRLSASSLASIAASTTMMATPMIEMAIPVSCRPRNRLIEKDPSRQK